MEFKTYVRKPFRIEAVQITEDNIVEVAELIGDGVVRRLSDGTEYFVPNRDWIRSLTRVEIGYWLTNMDGQYRVYRPAVFEDLFWPASGFFDRLVLLLDDNQAGVRNGI